MRKYMRFLFLVLSFVLISPARAAQHPTPLMDADCSEYRELPAQRISVASGIELYIYQDEHYVWLCYTYPPGSRGLLDMQLKTDKLASPLNLHVSAQLGEWPVDRDDLRPKGAESDLWWNTSGWTGTVSWINGMDTSGPTPRYRWKDAKAREIQLAKKRFGRGDWQFTLSIHVRDQSGKFQDVPFPADGSYFKLKAS
jgi:hypothetical protein